MKIKSITKIKNGSVHDISVDGHQNYTLEHGIITHNSGPAYSASTSIMLSKLKDKDGDGDTVIIKAVNDKSRFTKPNKEVKLRLSYSTGLDKYYGLKDIAEKHGIIKRVGNRYKFSGTEDMVGRLQIDNNPKKYYTKEILEQVNLAAEKEFRYGNELKLQNNKSDGIGQNKDKK